MKEKLHDAELAGIGRRFWASFIDGIILGIVFGAIAAATGSDLEGNPLQLALTIAYFWYFLARRNGQTLGKRALNVRVVKLDGTQLSDSDALVRVLVSWVSGAVLLIGYLYAIHDDKNQTWHDKAARTIVIDVRDQ